MQNPQQSQPSGDENEERGSKRNVIKPVRYRSDAEMDSPPIKKKKSRAKSVKSNKGKGNKKSNGKKGRADKKKKKKPKKVERSKVVLKKKRRQDTASLDKILMEKLGARNTAFRSPSTTPSTSQENQLTPNNRSMPSTPNIIEPIRPREIAPNLCSAIRDGQKYYIAGTQIKSVPSEYYVPRNSMGSRLTNNGGESRNEKDKRQPIRRQLIDESQKKTQEAASVSNEGIEENEGDQSIEVEGLTFASIVSRIPEHIIRARNRGTQAMYILRLIYTRDQIAKSSITGKKSEFPSFVENYGSGLFSLFTKVLLEKFGIHKQELATLLSKRINYIRNSPKILRIARTKREMRKEQKELESRSVSGERDIDVEIQFEEEEQVEKESNGDLGSEEEESDSNDDESEEDDSDEDDIDEDGESEEETDGSGQSVTEDSDDSDIDNSEFRERSKKKNNKSAK